MGYFLFFPLLFFCRILFAQNTNMIYQVQISKGLYSNKVELHWDAVPHAEFYKICRVYHAPYQITKRGMTNLIIPTILEENFHQTEYTDETIPYGEYKYIITAMKTNITPILKQHKKIVNTTHQTFETNLLSLATITNYGYRTVTDKEFFLEFQKTIDSSLPRIRTMKMLNFFGERVYGLQSGQLVYKTTGIFRHPFRVMIAYTNFIDQNLVLNGIYEIQIFKLFAQKGKLVGTFYVDGIYKGTVTHNLIISGGHSTGGTYEIQQTNGKITTLPWNITTHPLDDSLYKDNLNHSLKNFNKN